MNMNKLITVAAIAACPSPMPHGNPDFRQCSISAVHLRRNMVCRQRPGRKRRAGEPPGLPAAAVASAKSAIKFANYAIYFTEAFCYNITVSLRVPSDRAVWLADGARGKLVR